MLRNLLRNTVPKGFYSTCARNVLYQNQRTATSQSDANINDDLQIEANLFENSKLKYNPVRSSEEFLRKETRKNPVNQSKQKRIEDHPKLSKIIEDPELGLKFYRDSKLLAPILINVRSRKQRDKKGKIIIEGRRLIAEALKCNLHLNALVFSQRDQLMAIKDEVAKAQQTYKSQIFKICQHELKMWSTLATPPGLLAVFERPSEGHIRKENRISQPLPISVICDNIREPNNLGSIIRTCAALPCTQLIVTKGCCDPWESKALRGGCGAHFRLPIREDVCWTEIDECIPAECEDDYRVFIAENNFGKALENTKGKAASTYQDIGNIASHNFIIIGGETHGVSEEAYKFLENGRRGKCLFIPLADGIESLNVASALTLILYEFRSKILKSEENSGRTLEDVNSL